MARKSRCPLPTETTGDAILAIAARHGVRRVRVFGSWARGTAAPDSDLDLIVDFDPGRDLFDLIGFKQDVEAATGRHVDVVTEGALSPYLRDDVLREAVAL